MKLLGIDLETTGLDIQKHRILKLGMVLYTDDTHPPVLEREWTLWHDTYPEITPEAQQAHGISKFDCIEYGENPMVALQEFVMWCEKHQIDYLIAHNGYNFDFPMLLSNCDAFAPHCVSYIKKVKKIDTSVDVPYPGHIQTRKLIHLAAEHGFVNPFPHSALSDIRTMFKIMFEYPIERIIERAGSPLITVRAGVDFHTKEFAKAKRYSWDSQNQRWLKKIKECDLQKEIESSEFEVHVLT